MSSFKFGQEREFLKKRYEKMRAEYFRTCININTLSHNPSTEELEEIIRFNSCIWRELGGSGNPPSE